MRTNVLIQFTMYYHVLTVKTRVALGTISKYKREKDTQSKDLDWVSFSYYSNLWKSNIAIFDYRYVSTTVYLIF